MEWVSAEIFDMYLVSKVSEQSLKVIPMAVIHMCTPDLIICDRASKNQSSGHKLHLITKH